jgi:hypothetical protein
MAPLTMVLEVDPYRFFFDLVLTGQEMADYQLLYIIFARFALQTAITLNGFRTMLFVSLSFVIATKLQRSHLSAMKNCRNFRVTYDRLTLYYSMLYICIHSVDVYIVAPIAFTLLSIALYMEIVSVFVAIRMYELAKLSIVGLFIYVFFISLAILVCLISDIEIPDSVRIFEDSEMLLHNWKSKFVLPQSYYKNGHHFKYAQRKL